MAAHTLKKTFHGLTEMEIVHNWLLLDVCVKVFDLTHEVYVNVLLKV